IIEAQKTRQCRHAARRLEIGGGVASERPGDMMEAVEAADGRREAGDRGGRQPFGHRLADGRFEVGARAVEGAESPTVEEAREPFEVATVGRDGVRGGAALDLEVAQRTDHRRIERRVAFGIDVRHGTDHALSPAPGATVLLPAGAGWLTLAPTGSRHGLSIEVAAPSN